MLSYHPVCLCFQDENPATGSDVFSKIAFHLVLSESYTPLMIKIIMKPEQTPLGEPLQPVVNGLTVTVCSHPVSSSAYSSSSSGTVPAPPHTGYSGCSSTSSGWLQWMFQHQLRLVTVDVSAPAQAGYSGCFSTSSGWLQWMFQHQLRLVTMDVSAPAQAGYSGCFSTSSGWLQWMFQHQLLLVTVDVSAPAPAGYNGCFSTSSGWLQ